MADVAWIGLGAMGSRMVVRLVAAGHQVTVWNRPRERAEDLARRADVRVAATAADAAAGAEVVALMVTDAAAVTEVTQGPDGVLNGVSRGDTLGSVHDRPRRRGRARGGSAGRSHPDGRAGSRFALRLARKDADLILDAARRGGADPRVGAAVAAWLADAVAGGLGDQDYTAVLGQILSTAPSAGAVE